MSTSTAPSARRASDGKETHALSCSNCRQRKVRCTKTHPCPQCVRGGLECVFPSRKKDRRPRTSKNNELLSRLAKLEAIVGRVDPPALDGNSNNAGGPASSTAAAAALQRQRDQEVFPYHPEPPKPAPQHANEGRKPEERGPAAPFRRDDPAARYLSGEFWANLCGEVEGIKHALAQPSDSEDGDDDDDVVADETSPGSHATPSRYGTPGSMATSAAMFGNASAAGSSELPHPPPERMRALVSVYFYNVDPLLKILHKPTILGAFEKFMASPNENTLDKTTEALFFAIYFAAITSLSPENCTTQLGEERAPLVVRYRQAAELALCKADYLNSTSLVSLQALTIYVTCLRNHSESRASWALLALVLRLSQAIGIHRDGDGAAFPPYEAEMRRRLWSQVVVLDVRAVEDRGTEPMIAHDDYSTLPATNVDDADFGPETAVPVQQLARDGPTDVTFSLCTYKCSGIFLYIHAPRSRSAKGAGAGDQAAEDEMVRRVRGLEEQFVEASDPGHFASALAARVVRLCALIYWLSVQYPFHRARHQPPPPPARPRVSREHVLRTAVGIMELQELGRGADREGRFGWWTDTYVQWHPLAVALAELCVQTDGPLVARAWGTVDRVLPVWAHKVADAERGALWRPIKKLLKKARAARAEAQMSRLKLEEKSTPQAQETVVVAAAAAEPAGITLGTPSRAQQLPEQQPFSNFGMPGFTQGPAPFILENAHNVFNIDFGEVSEDIGATPSLDIMDWSSWNDFVNDAAAGADGQSLPSSEEDIFAL